MTTWRVFAAGSPANPNNDDGNAYTLATGWLINQAGSFWCVGVEWFAPTTLPTGDFIVGLWSRVDDATPGTLLATKTVPASGLTPGARNAILFDPGDEVAVSQASTAGFYAVIYTNGRYTSTGSYFGTDDISGPITAWSNGSVGGNGRFFAGGTGLTYPNGQFAAGGYWVSPIVTDEDPGGVTPVSVTDAPGPAAAGGTPDTARAGVVVTDQRGPALAGGTPEALILGVQVNDSGGGAAVGGSPSETTGDTSVTDRPGPVLAGGSPVVVSTGEPVSVTDRPGPAAAGGAPDTPVISEAQPDLAVWPLLVQALACLQSNVAALESPPKYVQIRPGITFSAGLSQIEDECCEGSAWIRVVSITPTDTFPSATGVGNCGPYALAVELELGIVRCAPTRSDVSPDQLTTGTQWYDAARLVMNDAAALRRTACCIAALGDVDNFLIGQWTPQQVEANCMGGTMTMTIQAPACDFTCG